MSEVSRRTFLQAAAGTALGAAFLPQAHAADAPAAQPAGGRLILPPLMGNRFFTFNSVIRVNQIEVTRERNAGQDEASIHTPQAVQALRDAFEKGWPGGRMTWAFSWRALQDSRENYRAIRKQVVGFHHQFGDEITFIPGGYFANMYNTRQQVNKDLHDALAMVSAMVGHGYRPRIVLACYLAAENQRFLAEEEGIHVCQGNAWSSYAIDSGDGEGSVNYPYYPSREHFCKPAQGNEDFIDCVNLDGWTMDFLSARHAGASRGFNSRMGVGPLETVFAYGTEVGVKEMLATTAAHFDQGFALNGFAWVTNGWEACLVEGWENNMPPREWWANNMPPREGWENKLNKDRNGLDGLVLWLSEVRRRWPHATCITQGEFGLTWREQFKDNSRWSYRFVQRGSGIGGSDENMEIRWFMNKDFRLALLRDWKANGPEMVIDFTRYDLKAAEPKDMCRNWSLMNRLNQKGTRPQDKPIPLAQLASPELAMIRRRYADL
ncbi:MAG: DUF3863 domain-containing protein [Planctomycetes bacterium]|nr:DUF3863 domain-containing protein [Planctomycetota bacterium]